MWCLFAKKKKIVASEVILRKPDIEKEASQILPRADPAYGPLRGSHSKVSSGLGTLGLW